MGTIGQSVTSMAVIEEQAQHMIQNLQKKHKFNMTQYTNIRHQKGSSSGTTQYKPASKGKKSLSYFS